MLARYCGPGLLGLGITALIAGFMSGMAGNVSAFTTVWTYDIYGALINKNATDRVEGHDGSLVHGLLGVVDQHRHCVPGDGSSQSIMDYVQALFSFFIAPLFGTVLLGMLWKRATKAGGFWGLFAGTLSSIGMWAWVKVDPGAVSYVALSSQAQDQAQNMFRALWCCLIWMIVTGRCQPGDEAQTDDELKGLVYGLTAIPHEGTFRSSIPAAFLGGGCGCGVSSF